MKIAVLAVQGAFAEHRKKIEDLGIECMELRKKEDLMKPFDGLILPGGESTVQGKLLKELDMYQILKQKIEEGLPVLATCAGLILLAENLTNDRNIYFATLPATGEKKRLWQTAWKFPYSTGNEGNRENTDDIYKSSIY